MTFALWMLLVAILLPIISTGISKYGAPGLDNNRPRDWQETLSGWRKRADWAHRNHFEAMPGFIAAVLVATYTHAPQGQIDRLAGLWAIFRIGYTACYITDRATLRSVMWTGGFVCVVALFVISA